MALIVFKFQKRQEEKDEDANRGKKQNLLFAKSRALKDGKTIPNLVFKIEAFERDIIKLTKRCGVDLFGDKYPKISTCRDFRVKEIVNDNENRQNSSKQSEEKEDGNESEESSRSENVSMQ